MKKPLENPKSAPNSATPDWTSTVEQVAASNIGWLMKTRHTDCYEDVHQWSVREPGEYWGLVVERLGVRFRHPFRSILDLTDGVEQPHWFAGGQLNIVESCFNAESETPAIIYQAQGGSIQTLSYGELSVLTDRVAANLQRCGFQVGDALAILMPMTAESVAIYLGIIKAGCVVVGIADSFRSPEIATRLRLSNAKAIFTQDVLPRGEKTFPLYATAVDAGAAKAIVIPAHESLAVQLRPEDLSWDQFLACDESFEAVVQNPESFTNILFSSGTTGDPKVIPWNQTTPLKCAADAHFHQDVQLGDVVAWPTNLGWMMGPWLIFASLMNRATIALYYGAPTGREFGQFVQNAKVTVMGVIPSLVKTWRASGCMEGLDWHSIKLMSSTGECSNASDMRWLMKQAGDKPLLEYCGGTELGGAYITQTLARPIVAGTFSTPTLGVDLVILDEAGQPAEEGEMFLIPPSIGMSTTLVNQDHHDVYYAETPLGPKGEKLRRHGDEMRQLGDRLWQPQGRADDTMNLGGIKVSSAEIERALQSVEGVAETAAIAIADQGGPSLLVIYVVCSPATVFDRQAFLTQMQAAIAKNLNPLFKIHDVVPISLLPRTASNKVMRRTLRSQHL